MKYILGKNREQTFIFPVSVDETVSKDNDVRLIDLFVDGLNIGDFGFRVDFGENGRPAYHPADLLKRQWVFSYRITKKGMDRASSDVGFMLTAYNLRRILI
ncbi:MAG: hypothetical protein A2W98_01845 [Bacteroidetes bacterium GWF2_33_38]|nr:MAG: hypothetical protein A2W98_01845 [Bacteroidetes bacterium GWF2_33_38]